MFDHVTIDESFKFPGCEKVYGLQTKDLGNDLIRYHVNKFGRLINMGDDHDYDMNIDRDIRVIGSPAEKMTSKDLVEFKLKFVNGFLVCISEMQSYVTEETEEGWIEIKIPFWMKLYRIWCITWWELKMLFKPPDRNQRYIIPGAEETILF